MSDETRDEKKPAIPPAGMNVGQVWDRASGDRVVLVRGGANDLFALEVTGETASVKSSGVYQVGSVPPPGFTFVRTVDHFDMPPLTERESDDGGRPAEFQAGATPAESDTPTPPPNPPGLSGDGRRREGA